MQNTFDNNTQGADLERRADALDRIYSWVQTASWPTIIIIALAAMGVGGVQDTLAPFLALLDAGMGPIDEVILGVPPVIVLFEVIRRGTGFDALKKMRELVSGLPTWVLGVSLLFITGGVTALDLSIYVPFLGAVTWIVEYVDAYLIGLPTLLFALEWRRRWSTKSTNQST